MTEAEFNQSQADGNVTHVDKPTQTEPPSSKSPDEYEAILQSVRSPRNYLSQVPTFVPKSFAESIQYVDDGVSKKAYFYINGQWVAASVISGPQLVAYEEADSASEVTISGLDLNADQAYKIIVLCSSGATNDGFNFRLNDDDSSVYNEAHTGYPDSNAFSADNTEVEATEGNAFRQMQSEILLSSVNELAPILRINTAAVNVTGNLYVIDSSWRYNGNSDITSIRFFTILGNNMQWRIWVFKFPTS